jgi:hypothetical protein
LIQKTFIYSVIFIFLILPGCSTFPDGSRTGSWALSKAKDAAAHAGARYLQKKTDAMGSPDQSGGRGFPPGTTTESAVDASLQKAEIEPDGIRSQGRALVRFMLRELSFAVGWESSKPKARFPRDMSPEMDQCFFTNSSLNDDSFMEIGSKQSGRPVARFNGKKVTLGFRWRFIAITS